MIFMYFVLNLYIAGALAQKRYTLTLYEEAYIYQFSNMGSLRMFSYEMPQSTEVCQWCFRTWNTQNSSSCPVRETFIYLQPGSLPNAPYQGSRTFPEYVSKQNVEYLNSSVLSNQTVRHCVDILSPISSTWFTVAYLNEIEQNSAVTKFYSEDCSYIIQVNVTSTVLTSLADIGVGYPITLNLQPLVTHLRYYITGNILTYTLSVSCHESCSLIVSVRAGGLPLTRVNDGTDGQLTVNCTETVNCQLEVTAPRLDVWHYVNIVNLVNSSVSVQLLVNASVCQSVQLCNNGSTCATDDLSANTSLSTDSIEFNATTELPLSTSSVSLLADNNLTRTTTVVQRSGVVATTARSRSAESSAAASCTDDVILMLREENPAAAFDMSSTVFYIVDDAATYVSRIDVDRFKDTGGTLQIYVKTQLITPKQAKSAKTAPVSVQLCIQSGSLPYKQNSHLVCSTAVDYLTVNIAELQRNFVYPQPGPWFIAFTANCSAAAREAEKCAVLVALSIRVKLGSCVNEGCVNGGQCRAYTKGVYSYTACSCIAGYRGYTCEDDSEAASEQIQVLYTCLLTLTNLGFVPAIIVACYRRFFVEAVVYFANMFFSAFYHWCDMSTWSKYVMCIAPYGSLQFCDFLCSILSFWVTLLAIAKIPYQLRFTAFVFGVMAVILPVHINHTGVLTYAIPIIVGLAIIFASWMMVCYRRKHCYPPGTQLLWMLPGILLAIVAVCLFAFAETDANYPYTHSVWHLCISISIVFLLPRIKVKIKDGSSSDSSSYELDHSALISCQINSNEPSVVSSSFRSDDRQIADLPAAAAAASDDNGDGSDASDHDAGHNQFHNPDNSVDKSPATPVLVEQVDCASPDEQSISPEDVTVSKSVEQSTAAVSSGNNEKSPQQWQHLAVVGNTGSRTNSDVALLSAQQQ